MSSAGIDGWAKVQILQSLKESVSFGHSMKAEDTGDHLIILLLWNGVPLILH